VQVVDVVIPRGEALPPISGLFVVAGAVDADNQFISTNLTADFGSGNSFTFPTSTTGPTFAGFIESDGPIGTLMLSAAVGRPFVSSLGAGWVPEPGSLAIVTSAVLLGLRRRR
jgi:hypothetical protein